MKNIRKWLLVLIFELGVGFLLAIMFPNFSIIKIILIAIGIELLIDIKLKQLNENLNENLNEE